MSPSWGDLRRRPRHTRRAEGIAARRACWCTANAALARLAKHIDAAIEGMIRVRFMRVSSRAKG